MVQTIQREFRSGCLKTSPDLAKPIGSRPHAAMSSWWLSGQEDIVRWSMGLSWQQGPLSVGTIGRFLVPEPLPHRLLYVEPLRRRIRVRFGGAWIADSEQVLLLFEPGRYPVVYFAQTDISPRILERTEHTTRHPDLGLTAWYTAKAGKQHATRAAWEHIELPSYAG